MNEIDDPYSTDPATQFQRQVSADLQWVINSPSLLDPARPEVTTFPAFEPDEDNARRLLAFLADHGYAAPANDNSRPSRIVPVGRYFEHLLLFYLMEIRGFEIVGNGIQVEHGGRTVGEFDFLYRDDSGVFTHLEASVKFYLRLPVGQHNNSQHVGPNSADTFERKVDHLFDHQLLLSREHQPDVKRMLAFVKGRIYYHVDTAPSPDRPPRLSRNHLQGRWLHHTDIGCLNDPALRYRVLRKPHWLSDHVESDLLSSTSFKELVASHFHHMDRPLHVAVYRDGAIAHNLFVVHDAWPT